MNRSQFQNKASELANNYKMCLLEKMLYLYDSGAVDTQAFIDNFVLPRLLMAVALENQYLEERENLAKIYPQFAKEIENLKKF